MDGIPLDALGIGSGWALVALFVVLIYRGVLVPRPFHLQIVEAKDKMIADREAVIAKNDERDEKKNELVRNLTLQNAKMLEALPVATSVLTALHQAVEGDPPR